MIDDSTEANMVCLCGHPAVAHVQPKGDACADPGCSCVEFIVRTIRGVPVRTDQAWPLLPGGYELWLDFADGTQRRVWPPPDGEKP